MNNKGEIDVSMLMDILKHRYQDEEGFMPITEECWRDYCEEEKVKRPLSSCLTQSSIIATLHPKYEETGGKLWYLNASPHAGIYFPLYGRLKRIAPDFVNEDGQDKSSNWWQSRQLQGRIDENYPSQIEAFKKSQENIQNEILTVNAKFELLNEKDLLKWEEHQERLSTMAKQILLTND